MAGAALHVIEPEGWLDQVLEDFERAMLRRQLSANTVRIYRWAVRQKGGSEKRLMAPPAAMEMLHDYLKARADDSPWAWISHRSNAPLHRLTPAGVREIWHKLARKAGVKYWTTHQLRHTGATELLDAGVPELVIAEHLGHHGLATLHNYSQVRQKQRQQAVDVMERLMEPPILLPKRKTGPR